MGQDNLPSYIAPYRMSGKGGRYVCKKAEGHEQKDFFNTSIGTFDDEPPEGQASQWNNEVDKGSMWIIGQHLDTGGNTEEFRYRHASISDKQSKHGKSCPAYTKLLPNEVCQAFASDSAHTCAHLLHNSQAEASNGQRP